MPRAIIFRLISTIKHIENVKFAFDSMLFNLTLLNMLSKAKTAVLRMTKIIRTLSKNLE